jgi:hypothetical protein
MNAWFLFGYSGTEDSAADIAFASSRWGDNHRVPTLDYASRERFFE